MSTVNIKRFIDTSEESVSRYLKEVRKIDMLTPEEEVELARKVKEGDAKAIERLTTANLRFVISIAKEYQGQGIPLSDLINEGYLGSSLKLLEFIWIAEMMITFIREIRLFIFCLGI